MATQQLTKPSSPANAAALWRRQTAVTAILLLVITVAVSRIDVIFFPLYQVQSQDVLPLVVLASAMFAASMWSPAWRLPRRAPGVPVLLAIGAAMVGLLAFGTYALMDNFPLSIDERMVLFDMSVFERMQLATPLAASWRPYVTALMPAFLLNPTMPTGVVSSYLPMNALLRAAFSKVADPVLFNPLLALAGGAALLDIARRVFGRDNRACWVVLLVYALSAQMLVNAMTVYSMTAHMALNLIWLAAFLRGGRIGHSVAIVTGFVATGLHQLAFHPFFVAPFILWRIRHREWRQVLLYGTAYAAIILWWIYYPILASHAVASSTQSSPGSNFLARIGGAISQPNGGTIFNMFCNLLHFAAWQNITLIPLISASAACALRERGLPAVLLFGIALWLTFLTFVMPFQGHGWGYRYLHPYLGSFALLAGYGYQELKAIIGRSADGFVIGLSGVTAVVTIPLLFVAAHRFILPYATLEQLVARQSAPMVLIDTSRVATVDGRWAQNAIETVRNSPDLANHPLRIASSYVSAEQLAALCRIGRITVVSRADQRRVGFATNGAPSSPLFDSLVDTAKAEAPHCLTSAEGLD